MKHNITVVFALLSCVTATAQFNEAAPLADCFTKIGKEKDDTAKT